MDQIITAPSPTITQPQSGHHIMLSILIPYLISDSIYL